MFVKVKINVFKSVYLLNVIFRISLYLIFFPILGWVLIRSLQNKTQSIEMRYCRRILGFTRKDRIKHNLIRHRLQVLPEHKCIDERQLGWFGHLSTMDGESPVIKDFGG